MGNVIFLSANYEYTCSVAEKFAKYKDMFFVSTNDMIEYELSVLEVGADLNAITEQTLLRLLQYEGCAIAMGLDFLKYDKVKELCFDCKNLVYLPLDKESLNFPYSLVGDELEGYFSSKAKYILLKDQIPACFKDIKIEE